MRQAVLAVCVLLAAQAAAQHWGEQPWLDGPGDWVIKPGVYMRLYKPGGKLKDFPNFRKLKPQKTVVVPTLDYGKGDFEKRHGPEWDDHFAARIEARINIPRAGVYEIFVTSDDGSRLWFGNDVDIENGGRHPPRTRSVKKRFTRAPYDFLLHFFEAHKGDVLRLEWKPPGGKREVIPAGHLQHVLWVKK